MRAKNRIVKTLTIAFIGFLLGTTGCDQEELHDPSRLSLDTGADEDTGDGARIEGPAFKVQSLDLNDEVEGDPNADSQELAVPTPQQNGACQSSATPVEMGFMALISENPAEPATASSGAGCTAEVTEFKQKGTLVHAQVEYCCPGSGKVATVCTVYTCLADTETGDAFCRPNTC